MKHTASRVRFVANGTRIGRLLLAVTGISLWSFPLLAQDGEAGDTSVSAEQEASAEAEDRGAGDTETQDAEAESSETSEGDATSEDSLVDGSSELSAEVVDSSEGSLFESAMEESVSETSEGGGGLAFSLNGYGRGDVYVGKIPAQDKFMAKAAYGELALKLSTPRQEYGALYAETRFRYGLQQSEADSKLITDLREVYVDSSFGPVDLKLGHQIIVWGKADAFNPTNNLTPMDLRVRSPLEDDRRVGNVGARMFVNFQPFRLEGVWMPIYAPTQVPLFDLPQYVRVENAPTQNRMSDSLVAGRLHLELSALEFSVSYLRGLAPMPGLKRAQVRVNTAPQQMLENVRAGAEPEILIHRTPYRHQVIGADFSTSLGEFMTLRGEAAYRLPDNHALYSNAPRPDVQFALGGDKTFGSVSVVAQYLGRYTLDWAKDGPPEGVGNSSILGVYDATTPAATLQRTLDGIDAVVLWRNQILFQQLAELQHIATLRLEWLGLHDTLSLSAQGMYNVTTTEFAAHPKIAYRFSDSLSGSLGAEIYAGPDETLMGMIDAELSAGYAELRVTY